MSCKRLGIALAMALPFSAQATSLAVESMTITGGSFVISGSNLGIDGCGGINQTWVCLLPGPAAQIDDGIANDGAMDADGLWGSPAAPVVASPVWAGSPVLGYFAHTGSNNWTDPDPDGLTAVVDTASGTLSADFSGFFFNWADHSGQAYDFLVGGTATGAISPIAVNAAGVGQYGFVLSWTSPASDPTLNTPAMPTIHVNLAGTFATAVPEPHLPALMLTGLGLVWYAARRRRA